MSINNEGNQTITYKFTNSATAEALNKYTNKVIKDGIYDGGICSMVANVLTISAFVLFLRTSTGQGIRIETSTNVESDLDDVTPLIPVTVSEPYIVCNFTWQNNATNYLDWYAKSSGNIDNNDIVFAKALFTGSVVTGFDITNKTWGLFDQQGNVYVKNNLIVSGNFSHAGIMEFQREIEETILAGTKNYLSVSPITFIDNQEITLEDGTIWKFI